MKRGRPAAIRSRVAAGVGGRRLTDDETDALKRLALLYSGEARRVCEADEEGDLVPDELEELEPAELLQRFGHVGDWDEFLADVERLFGQYQADASALHGTKESAAGRRTIASHASSTEELADLRAIVADAREVLALLERYADIAETRACIVPVGRLRDRLLSFPPRAQAQLTEDPPCAVAFEQARVRLLDWLHHVRDWPTSRASHVRDLCTVLQACEDVLGTGITVSAWSRTTARERFKRQLRELYRADWDDDRRAVWRERIATGETLPPPPSRDEAFAEAVLDVFVIPRETRPRKG